MASDDFPRDAQGFFDYAKKHQRTFGETRLRRLVHSRRDGYP